MDTRIEAETTTDGEAMQVGQAMQAIVQRDYGSADTLEVAEIPRPSIGPGEVLIEVRAAGVDRGVWHIMTGLPYLIRLGGYGVTKPKSPVPGLDVSGEVVEVGDDVERFRDEVFGIAHGSYAEYAAADESKLAHKPANITFEQAAVASVSGITALQALIDVADVQPGQSVLVIGASGGVGTYAVQMAKAPDAAFLLPSGSSLSVSLIAVSFYQTLGALQLPLSFLLISVVALALAGTSARAGATLAGSRRSTWSAVMLDRELNLGVMPDREIADPIHALDPIARGVVGIGRVRTDQSGVRWLPVDSPAGKGFVDAQFVTPEVGIDAFMSDPRPARLLRKFGRNLSSGRNVARLVSRRGLIVALRDSVTVVPRTDIARWRETGPRIDASGSIPSIRRQILEPFIESFAATSAFTPHRPHSRSALIPTECWNFPYLALARPDEGSAWLVYFEYRRGRPRVVGIGLDV